MEPSPREQGGAGSARLSGVAVYVAALAIVAGLLLQVLVLFLPYDATGCDYTWRYKRKRQCHIWTRAASHMRLEAASIGLLVLGGIALIPLAGTDRGGIARGGSPRRPRATSGPDTGTDTPHGTPLPSYLAQSVPEVGLAGRITDAAGCTWWVEIPVAGPPARVTVTASRDVQLRLLVGRQGEWVSDLMIGSNPFECMVSVPSPHACLCLVPVAAVAEPVDVSVSIDLPGQVDGARPIV